VYKAARRGALQSAARRERMLASFTEKDTYRTGIVVLAAEGPRVTFDGGRLWLFLGAAVAAFCIWIAVRLVNRRNGGRSS
jgi:hypothetical protein